MKAKAARQPSTKNPAAVQGDATGTKTAPRGRRGTSAAAGAAAPAARTPRYFMRRPGTYAGQVYDRDQLMTLQDQPNDERLERLGYIAKFTGEAVTCGDCGAQFRTAGSLEGHVGRRHRAQARVRPTMQARQPGESQVDYEKRRQDFERAVLADEESRDQRDERENDRVAPLNWENTKASREDARL